MERIKFFLDETPFQKTKQTTATDGINFNEIKKFLSEVDNYSFDQIRLRLKPKRNKIVIDVATGIQYPAYNDFMAKIQQSKYASFFDLK